MYIKNKLDQLNFKEITPIQAGVFKHFKHQKHLVGLAPTGTGKTHAYLLPILENITFQKNEVQALI
ncbi:MAG: DNA helicase, partial [Tenericutes bacterium HGW-Tenericutes-6]